MDKVICKGVDTYCETVAGNFKELILQAWVSENNSYIDKNGMSVLAIKPGIVYGKREPVELTELEGVIELMKNKNSKLNRIDIALDFEESLGDNFTKSVLYTELWNAAVGNGKSILRTHKGFDKLVAIKSMGDNQLVIYDSTDKERLGSTRIEFRFFRIRNTDNVLDNAKQKIKRIMEINKTLNDYLPSVEERYSRELIELYKKELGSKVATFTEFVSKYEKYFLTGNIFKKVYEASGLKRSSKRFLYDTRKNRPDILEFALKKEIKDLQKIINNEMKALLKS